MALNVGNPGEIQLQFTPSPEVVKEAALSSAQTGGAFAATAPLTLTSEQILFTRTTVLTGDNSPANLASKRQEILDYFHRTYSCYEKLFEVMVSDAGA
jgi:hypothetical protein